MLITLARSAFTSPRALRATTLSSMRTRLCSIPSRTLSRASSSPLACASFARPRVFPSPSLCRVPRTPLSRSGSTAPTQRPSTAGTLIQALPAELSEQQRTELLEGIIARTENMALESDPATFRRYIRALLRAAFEDLAGTGAAWVVRQYAQRAGGERLAEMVERVRSAGVGNDELYWAVVALLRGGTRADLLHASDALVALSSARAPLAEVQREAVTLCKRVLATPQCPRSGHVVGSLLASALRAREAYDVARVVRSILIDQSFHDAYTGKHNSLDVRFAAELIASALGPFFTVWHQDEATEIVKEATYAFALWAKHTHGPPSGVFNESAYLAFIADTIAMTVMSTGQSRNTALVDRLLTACAEGWHSSHLDNLADMIRKRLPPMSLTKRIMALFGGWRRDDARDPNEPIM